MKPNTDAIVLDDGVMFSLDVTGDLIEVIEDQVDEADVIDSFWQSGDVKRGIDHFGEDGPDEDHWTMVHDTDFVIRTE